MVAAETRTVKRKKIKKEKKEIAVGRKQDGECFGLLFVLCCELFLTGNEITKVEGLEGLHDLRELVLDRNKIKIISDYAFANQWNLQELHMEENRLREVAPLGCLENLQRLYLGSNRIQVSLLLRVPSL